MKIEFLAHACFLITRENGMKIMVDPYESGGFSGRVGYDKLLISLIWLSLLTTTSITIIPNL